MFSQGEGDDEIYERNSLTKLRLGLSVAILILMKYLSKEDNQLGSLDSVDLSSLLLNKERERYVSIQNRAESAQNNR